ncbi:MAG: MBL fold metallo-hydrolase [Faecalibacterium sp.]
MKGWEQMKFIRTIHAVGQGAFYTEKLCFKNQQYNVVYDCGSATSKKNIDNEIVATYNQDEEIIAVFISHFDVDHINGLEKLLTYCKVKYVFLPVISWDRLHIIADDKNSAFVRNMVKDPVAHICKMSQSTKVVFVRPLYDEDDQGSFLYDGYDEIRMNNKIFYLEDSIPGQVGMMNSGTKIQLSSWVDRWVYVPCNVVERALISALQGALLAEDITCTSTHPDDLSKAKEVFDRFIPKKDRNIRSMVVYSGGMDAWKTAGYYEERGIAWLRFYGHRIKSGCMYLGDLKLHTELLKQLEDSYQMYRNNVGMVQVPHHGSRHNFHEDVFCLFKSAELYFICAGTKNKYRHPDVKVVQEIIVSGKILVKIAESCPLVIKGIW